MEKEIKYSLEDLQEIGSLCHDLITYSIENYFSDKNITMLNIFNILSDNLNISMSLLKKSLKSINSIYQLTFTSYVICGKLYSSSNFLSTVKNIENRIHKKNNKSIYAILGLEDEYKTRHIKKQIVLKENNFLNKEKSCKKDILNYVENTFDNSIKMENYEGANKNGN